MSLNGRNGGLPGNPIDVEPTEKQVLAHGLVSALTGDVDWEAAAANLSGFLDVSGQEGAGVEGGLTAAGRIYEASLKGQAVSPVDIEMVRAAIESGQRSGGLEFVVGLPIHYWQGWVIDRWLPRGCVAMLTGDGGVGKSRLALQLAWAISGGGQWLGEAGQMPALGADYGNGFEAFDPSPVVYATWEDSPEQIQGRLYWLERSGRVGNGEQFMIADMRSRGHLWSGSSFGGYGLTGAGESLREASEGIGARLLVVDTLGVANGASEIDRAQVGAFFSDWASWADHNDCTVLFIAHPPKAAGELYSGSTGILGGVRAMLNVESVRRDCRGDCGSARDCRCEVAFAYRLLNAKQNYGRRASAIWLSSDNGVWAESAGRAPDYDEVEDSGGLSVAEALEELRGGVD